MNTSKSLHEMLKPYRDLHCPNCGQKAFEVQFNELEAAIVEAVEGLVPEKEEVSYRFGKKISRDDDYAKGSRYGFNQCRNLVLQAIKEWQ